MLPLNVVTILFWSSTTATRTGGAIVAPGAVLVGCPTNSSFVAGPGGGGVAVTSNDVLVSPAYDAAVAVSVYPLPIWSIRKLAKVATPFTAATCGVPESRPPLTRPPLSPMATVTVPVKVATTVPAESNAVTCTGGRMVLSFIVPSGCIVNMRRFLVGATGGASLPPEGWNSLSEIQPAAQAAREARRSGVITSRRSASVAPRRHGYS